MEATAAGKRTVGPPPALPSNLDRLGGADVFAIFIESYGAVTYDRKEFAGALAPSRARLAAVRRRSVGYVFQALLKPTGAINSALSAVAGHEIHYAWLADTRWTLLYVALIHSWKWMGLAMLIYLAGLKTISADVLEASRIDGATPWQTFWHVRFPLLAPAMTFNVEDRPLGWRFERNEAGEVIRLLAEKEEQ